MAEKNREAAKSENSEPKTEKSERPRRQERPEPSKEGGTGERQNTERDVRKENEAGEAGFQPRSDVRRESRKAGKDDNVVFVGKKPAMAYVLAVITQFSDGNSEVFVKARGRSISRAVDVIEVVKKKFLQDVRCEMETDTEVITDERNQRINVSTFSAKLFK